MNKTTMVLLALLLVVVPKTNVQAASDDAASTVASPVSQSVIPTDLQLVVNQVEPLQVPAITLTNVVVDPEALKPKTIPQLAEQMVDQQFGAGQYQAFANIVQHESNWNPNAVNQSSGACGLGQALPCSKIADHSVTGQLEWMISYIADRYGTPVRAWKTWQEQGWY